MYPSLFWRASYLDMFPRYHITEAHYVLGIYIGSTSNAHFVAFARSTGCLSIVSKNRRRYRKLQYFLFSYMLKGDRIYFMTIAKVIKLWQCIFLKYHKIFIEFSLNISCQCFIKIALTLSVFPLCLLFRCFNN